jgi:hypothetical protein
VLKSLVHIDLLNTDLMVVILQILSEFDKRIFLAFRLENLSIYASFTPIKFFKGF